MHTIAKLGRVLPAIVVAAAIVVPSVAFAQGDARFTGTVIDPSGALVPGATIVVKNEQTGEERTVTSTPQGRYVVPNLKPAIYTIRARFGDFAALEFTGLPLVAAQEFTLDLTLQPKGVVETVTVEATASALDLSSARNGVNVSTREVASLPVNGRQMSQLLLQAPGSQNAGTGTWQDIRFSGRAVEQNVIRYDGIEGSAIIDSAPGNVNGENNTPFKLQASLENVQEFRVESNNYPAEYGTGTGGQVSVVTKSGSNAFHGALFEYYRSDKLDAPNYFDKQRSLDGSVVADLGKSKLKQNQFGGSIGGPIAKDRAFFFGSYEGYRLDAGLNFIEAVPSASAWARAVPAIAALRPGFLSPGAIVLPDASGVADFDIAQLQALQQVREDAFSFRFDLKLGSNWNSYYRFFRDDGDNDEPQGVTGRRFATTSKPTNFVANLQGVMGGSKINDFKIGYNAARTTQAGVPGISTFQGIAISLSGSVANNGIAGQGATSGIASPGGLVRVNSAGNGESAPYDPYSLTIADSFANISGNHYMKVGGEARLIRMSTDQVGGSTYTYQNIGNFLNNIPQQIQYFGDLSEPSPFHNGATGPKHIEQEYFVAFAQDEWKLTPKMTLNYGLRYDYYTVLRERDNRIVKFNIETGALDPDTTPLYQSKKNNFQPRISSTYAVSEKTVLRGGLGIFVGPGQTEDQIQPVEAERISTTAAGGGAFLYPVNEDAIRANFINNPNNRGYQPRAYANDYTLPERVYQYTASIQQELSGRTTATVAYVGSQGRNLFLRSIANRIVAVLPTGTALREFDIVTCANGTVQDGRTGPNTSASLCPGSTPASKQSPYAEVDYKTSGGHDSYNALQIAVQKRSARGLTLNGQYTLGYSKGNTAGSNEATTASNNARAIDDFDFEDGYNNFDVRHTFNISALYTIPGQGPLTGGWEVGGIFNGRSGIPVPVLIARQDIVWVDAAGNVFNNSAAGRTPVINTPGGGASRSTRRPDVVPGVDPFIKEGGLLFLNPAAFSTPAPGTFGNLERNSVHGPWFRQVDLVVSKRIPMGQSRNIELRSEFFNIFNITNFANPVGTLPNALPNNLLTEADKVQPGQPYTAGAAGTFGRLTSTVGRTVGLGTPRQIQFAARLTF